MLTKVHVMIFTTRAISKLIIPGIKIFSACLFKDFKISKFSSYNGGKMSNTLPLNIRQEISLPKFKRKLKLYCIGIQVTMFVYFLSVCCISFHIVNINSI